MLKLQTVIFSVLTLCILSNYAVIAIDEIEERQKLSLEGKLLSCYVIAIYCFNLSVMFPRLGV